MFLPESRFIEPIPKEYFYNLCQIPAINSMHPECGKEVSLANMNNPPVVEEPKAAEKPMLVLSIGSGTYPIFLQFNTKSSTSLEERIKQLIRDEVFSTPA